MTSDAKVGLLLGLVFIVIIAFLLNGLPNLLRNNDNDKSIVDQAIAAPGDGWSPSDRAELVANTYNSSPSRSSNSSTETTYGSPDYSNSTPNNSYNSTTYSNNYNSTPSTSSNTNYGNSDNLGYDESGYGTGATSYSPGAITNYGSSNTATSTGAGYGSETYSNGGYGNTSYALNGNTTYNSGNTGAGSSSESYESRSIPAVTVTTGENYSAASSTTGLGDSNSNVRTIPPVRTASSKTYTVAYGDNLTKIAIKFYGKAEGSKYSNMMGIYEANKDVLSSADSVREGQKIVIPALKSSSVSSSTTTGSSNYNAVSNLTTGSGSVNVSTGASNTSTASGRYEYYVVKENDSLWSIAVNKLDNGKRYIEIEKLNKDILPNPDALKPGLKIKLPR